MDTTKLKKFAQGARRQLLEQVSSRMEQVLRSDSVEIREKAKVVEQLKAEIEAHGKIAVIDRVAYTWFNRFCALRFMDVNHYTRIGAVSPVEGGTQPEVLLEAKQGHIDEDLARLVNPQVIFSLLNGQRPASDPQGEAYRLLLVGVCNSYSEVMPFLFEKIEDYTELLMPLDLLSENSVLHTLRSALGAEECEDVEVIGWLYQYYISERKDKVFEALKQNQKIEAGDIPAATQLFTPHWIVRYLVENSLGRLWMLNHPNSGLREKMEYYIEPVDGGRLTVDGGQPNRSLDTDFLKIDSPEELKLLDPACGSGHILTYAFDLLAAIYEEEGYASSDIPKLILEKNIFGVEIDPRAGALAAFALVMKARAKDRRFFTRNVPKDFGQDSRSSSKPSERLPVLPNICVLENMTFNDAELKQYMNAVGRDLFTEPLMETLRQFEQADIFGSLIRPMLTDAGYVRGLLEGKNLGGDMFYSETHKNVMKVLKFAEFLSPRYHAVVANPPYMGNRNMGAELRDFLKDHYDDVKADLFSAFIIRNFEFTVEKGQLGFMSPFVWMFISQYENLREFIIDSKTITSLIQLEYSGFEGAVVPICAYTMENFSLPNYLGGYVRLTEFRGSENQSPKTLEAIKNQECGWFFRAQLIDFKKITGRPIAYWVSDAIKNVFDNPPLENITLSDGQNKTGDNEKFLRKFWEVNAQNIGINKKWLFYAKGGGFRRWAGNLDEIVNWSEEARKHYRSDYVARIIPEYLWYKKGITWGLITSSKPSFRILPENSTFDVGGSSIFFENEDDIPLTLALLNTKLALKIFQITNPTLNFQVKNIRDLPYCVPSKKDEVEKNVAKLIEISTTDWNSFENSSEFKNFPILMWKEKKVSVSYSKTRSDWQNLTRELQRLEEENNSIFAETYNLDNEITSDVELSNVSLIINPYYRYSSNSSEEELEERLVADTMKEFISYAVGCMFGRYSLDKPGLVLANQGEGNSEFRIQISEFQKSQGIEPKITFAPDEDNVIPVLEGEWFEDDIAERFKKFLRVTFGEEHYDENLAFIEESIGRDVRSYFVKEFYKDHVQTYKKRPIYWMFSSAKGSFNALIYMHRYQPDTVSIVLNGYLREYIKKLTAHKSQLERTSVSGSASQSQKTKALKEITQVNKVLSELKEYEDDVLYPLATEQVRIDLDDGVKVNYGKFGGALSPIKGL